MNRIALGSKTTRAGKRGLRRFSTLSVIGSVLVLSIAVPASSAVKSAPGGRAPNGVKARPSTALCGSLTIWTDATRVPAVNDYIKANPCVKVTVTDFGYSANELQTKIGLFNQEGSGWPDLLWDPDTTDAGFLNSSKYGYGAQLNSGLVPQATLNQWAYNSLAACTVNGKIYCLRNDIAANVLWYNAPLMKKFGYAVPKTWAQWAAIGKEVAKQHPGYVIGTVGDTLDNATSADAYMWGSGCPSNVLVSPTTVRIDTSNPNCTRVAKMLDPLIKDGSVSKLAVDSPDFVKKYGVTDHLLMEVGATWYGAYYYEASFHPAKHTWGVANPLTWPNFHQTGDMGGGIWEVSSHDSTTQQQLAASAAEWLTTSPVYQATAPTYPANKSAAKVWLKGVLAGGFYANNPTQVFEKAATEIWPGSSSLLFSTDVVWADTVVPALVAGKSLASQLGPWGTALSNMAQSFGYTVVK